MPDGGAVPGRKRHGTFVNLDTTLSALAAEALNVTPKVKRRAQNLMSAPLGGAFVHRGARSEHSRPTCSIVVTSHASARDLQAAIDPVLSRAAEAGVEVISLRAGGGSDQLSVTRPQPGVSLIVAPASHSRARLRELGMARASGDVVALIDERPDLTIGWADQLRERLRSIALGEKVRSSRLPISVVVPVHRPPALGTVLAALRASELPRELWEMIVVTDDSDPDTDAAAARYADFVVRLRRGVPFGPAYARNRGFEVSAGESVVFIDADVQVHGDTLSRFAAVLSARPDVSAVFGSYDDAPAAAGMVSQYRNLLEHYCRQQHAGDAATFWAACGAIRSSVFAEVGMYDEWRFRRPQIEDLDLGRRIKDRGYTIVLHPEIQATHLKRWTLSGMLATDLRDRGIAWSRSVGTHGSAARTEQCYRHSAAENTVLTALAATLGLAAAFGSPIWMLAGALVLAIGVAWNNRGQLRWFGRQRGVLFAAATIPLDLARNVVSGVAFVTGTLMREIVGEPNPDAVVQAFAEVGLKTWPPVPTRRR